jgi:pteridine reductase
MVSRPGRIRNVAQQSLQGKVALVTGAARRVGAAIARRLHGAGARVVIHYRGSAAAARALEAELNAARAESAARVRADLLAPRGAERLVAAALRCFGRLDVLVNNASVFHATPVGRITARQWDAIVGSNLRAPLFLAQAAAPHLARTRGVIVNITDIHAVRPLRRYPVYSVAKAGLAALTRSLALELGPRVRVNAVAPGAVAWPDDGQLARAERRRVLASTPLRRSGSPADVALAVHYLCEAPFVTGEVVAVDGGRSVFI